MAAGEIPTAPTVGSDDAEQDPERAASALAGGRRRLPRRRCRANSVAGRICLDRDSISMRLLDESFRP